MAENHCGTYNGIKKRPFPFFLSVFIPLLLILFLLPRNLTAQQESGQDLTERIRTFINASTASNAVWSVAVRDTSGTLILDYDSTRMVRMASNSKLYISSALLHYLGPDFRFRTNVYGEGRMSDSTWVGNLHIVGSGDPSIDGNFYKDDALYVLHSFVDQLKARGILEVDGDIYGNEYLFDDTRYPRGWEWDDLSYYYAPEIGALSFNRNCVDLTVRATGRPGDTPSISWFPFNTDYVSFINEQLITPTAVRFNESYHRILGTNTILLRSTLPVGHIDRESLSITDPAQYFVDTFMKLADQEKITIHGEAVSDNNRRDWNRKRLLASHQSQPMRTLITRLNAESDNFYTEMLNKALAAYHLKSTGTTEGGLELVKEYLRSIGIPDSMVNFRDASGMASANLSTTASLSLLLHHMQESRHAAYWKDSMARAGYSGTLRNRFLASPLLGNVYGKTGFISGVRTLSGYLTTEDGNMLMFSIATNNYIVPTGQVDRVHEAILEMLYHEF